MSLTAYELRSEFEESYAAGGFGGSVAVNDGRTLDIKKALDTGHGRIVLSDADVELIATLDAYPPLKRASVDDADGPTVRRYDFMDGTGLRAEAARRNIGRHSAGKVSDVRDALEAQDQHIAAGDLPAANAVEVGAANTPTAVPDTAENGEES